MSDPSDLTTQIETTAGGPAAAAADGVSANAQPLPNLIDADRYLAGKQAGTRPPFGISFAKIVSPGAQQ